MEHCRKGLAGLAAVVTLLSPIAWYLLNDVLAKWLLYSIVLVGLLGGSWVLCFLIGKAFEAISHPIPPPPYSEHIFQEMEVDAAIQLFPELPLVGLLGVGNTGKTTFLRRLGLAKSEGQTPPRKLRATLCHTLRHPVKLFWVLDARGAYPNPEQSQDADFAWQLEVLKWATVLCIFTDHTHGDTKPIPSDWSTRREQHDHFLETMLANAQTREQLQRIVMLLNKQDLRDSAFLGDNEVWEWFEGRKQKWDAQNVTGGQVHGQRHSNRKDADCEELARLLAG